MRRRRLRRRIGVLIFLVVAGGVTVLAVNALSGSDHTSKKSSAARTSTTVAPTTTAAPRPPAGPFRISDGVNVRTGPGTNYPSLGTLELGTQVLVVCQIDGQTIDGPSGPTNKWVRITGQKINGYVTNQYVATGPAINDPNTIPVCPSV
jgi:uncharacterized protein YraI